MTEFALVRHSRYADGANPDYEAAVEPVEITAGEASLVRSAGGTVFATRQAAELAQRLANAAEGPPPARPCAPGYFSSLRIGSSEIYVDAR